MKKTLLFVLMLAMAATLICAVNYRKTNLTDKEKVILNTLLQVMQYMHFHPQELDDEFSKKSFDFYLDDLDGMKLFFTQAEVSQLKQYELKIDDLAKEYNLEFVDLSDQLAETAIARSRKFYEELIAQPFNLKKVEVLEMDNDKRTYATDEAALKTYWRKTLKYQIISKVDSKLEDQEKNEALKEKKTLDEIIKKAQKETKQLFDDWFDRMDELRRSDRFESYLNAMTHSFDPHSDYFSPKGKEDFDLTMGGRLEGIGARLGTKDDYAEVASIVPGGPAWKGKELEVGDLITKVTQKGAEPVDILGMRLDDVISLIRGKKGTVVILTVKKKDGTIKDVEIERDEVIIDVAYARSIILDLDDRVSNIGYIKLPMFYSSFDGGKSCAEDIAKEIDKLKAQNINGIILDLRYNGGGSLQDVVKMSGLFIEKGPIVQVKSRSRKPLVLEDEEGSVAYDGPLIVLVNTFSASASEILAAALQDYQRAVIVGSNSTFGKGTVQGFYDLDRVPSADPKFKPLGQVKLTIQKFYRINGGSNQLKGVIPDIILPDQFAFLEAGEKEEENALKWSQIQPISFGQNAYQLPDLAQLKAKSSVRVQQNPSFSLILDNAKLLKENEEETVYPLALKDFRDLMDQREAETQRFSKIMDAPVAGLNIKELQADMAFINADSSRIARHEDWLKQVKKDIYIEESLLIMRDMLGARSKVVKRN